MFLSLSAVLVLGVLVFFLIRFAGLPAWQAVVCTLFGFYLSSSSLAPRISAVCESIAHYLSGIHP